jgi:hypothetical protein
MTIRQEIRRDLVVWIFVVYASVTSIGFAVQSCSSVAQPPPTLAPASIDDFHKTQAIQALDQIRNIAIAANATTPPQMSTASTRLVVSFHEATVKTIQAAGSGWPATIETAVDNFAKGLPAADATVIAPYVALIDALLKGLS